ncbi:MAG: hypothetical protein KC582_03115 [Candidatus Magasanikbacteria bacterium]|nr:hypothetical protein [Candidatus Magasanikbacteria bacterium]MCA9389541.1 hypothetical protein [Candidatus Magasanikbacteria bacterium]MCA9391219.1 hypothetical protein [Candidatus Magasanikbacteria bacterium]USN52473.1 MAG: hypothetical protein H6759_00060 [Candidatus Nomurabacteria bacterium]
METPKTTTQNLDDNKAMEGRFITKDGTDEKDTKFHEIDMGVDEEATLNNLRDFLNKKK